MELLPLVFQSTLSFGSAPLVRQCSCFLLRQAFCCGQALFSGNVDDHFMIGIRLNRGSVQLYADFLQCDIIVASPIAVTTRLEEDSGGKAGERPQAKDFLSSVEILVADRADFMLMQARKLFAHRSPLSFPPFLPSA